MTQTLKAPFPYFGGKSSVAKDVWQRFGKITNYIEPFFGSGAVLLARPDHIDCLETVNDKDAFVANFWRVVQADPEGLTQWLDYPQNENDLHARHLWLVNQKESFSSRVDADPEFYDVKVAGWWCWGLCLWIGSGWCSGNGPWQAVDGKLLHVGNKGQGINRQLLHLGNKGKGINRNLTNLLEWIRALQERLRRVRVCSGDWSRVCGPSVTFKHGLTGVFLDPPYSIEADRCKDLYRVDCLSVANDVQKWCRENGDNPLMRIALCGYDGEHNALTEMGWDVLEWKTKGGYASQGTVGSQGIENAKRERIWFSPHCIAEVSKQGRLF